jgi:putative endonuclease
MSLDISVSLAPGRIRSPEFKINLDTTHENLCGASLLHACIHRKVGSVPMIFRRCFRVLLRFLDWCAYQVHPSEGLPSHLRVGARGEDDAYFHLRKVGYVMVARNFRSPRCRGEIDLIGWDKDMLCFIEVKTRTTKDVRTAEAAVDRHKRREVAQVAREYLRRLPSSQWRFDVVTVYYDGGNSRPQIEVFRNASLAA